LKLPKISQQMLPDLSVFMKEICSWFKSIWHKSIWHWM